MEIDVNKMSEIMDFLKRYEQEMNEDNSVVKRLNSKNQLRNLILSSFTLSALGLDKIGPESSRLIQEIFSDSQAYVNENITESCGIYSFTKATEIARMLQEANKGVFIDGDLIRRCLNTSRD
jgi:hypothetical protein